MIYALIMAFILIFWLIIAVQVLRYEVRDLWKHINGDPYKEWRKFLADIEEEKES